MKNINVNINPNDVRFVLKVLLERIFARDSNHKSKAIENLDDNLNGYEAEKIKQSLIEVLEINNRTSEELSEAAQLLSDLGSPDTEVLEDLPNLKKDSLGISGGSE